MFGIWRVFTVFALGVAWISAAGAADDGSRFAAIWVKRDGPAFVARHAMTSSQLQSEFDKYVGSQGYCLSWISGYAVNGAARYAALFEKKNCPAFISLSDLTSEQYQQEFDKWTGEGFRLKLVDGFAVGNKTRYAAIWEKTPGPDYVARHGLTSETYQQEFDLRTSQGFCLSQVSGYAPGSASRYAAIFEKGNCPVLVARHGLTSKQYQEEFDKWTGQGYRLVLVNGHKVDGKTRYAAIWRKIQGPAYVARHDMTSDQYQQEFDKWTSQGYRLAMVSAF